MQGKINVNIVLCQKYDDSTKTIEQMFNEITTNERNEASFSVITFINAIGDIQDLGNGFVLHYFLMKKAVAKNQKRQGIYLGAVDFTVNSEEEYEKDNYLSSSNSTYGSLTFEKVPFLEQGEYSIEVYKGSSLENKDESYTSLKKNASRYMEEGELISSMFFQVRLRNQNKRLF